MKPAKDENREHFERRLNARVWKDPSFRKKLLKEPRKALAEMGAEIPEEVRIFIHEENPTDFHLTIHMAPQESERLSEEQLAKLSAAINLCQC